MTRQALRRRLPFWAAAVLIFYLVPLMGRSEDKQLLQLFFLLPGLSFVSAWFYGLVNRFRWQYPLGVGVLFLPAVFLYYNVTAWYFTLVYAVVACIAVFFGSLWHKKN